MLKLIKVVLATASLMVTFPTYAQVITVSFSGSVTDLGALLEGDSVALGSAVNGSFAYDTNTSGALSFFNIAIGESFSASLNGSGNLSVQNDAQNGWATNAADGLTAFANATSSSLLNGYSNPSMQFGLRKENVLGQLWGDTLPPDLADWANVSLGDIQAPDWHWMDFGLVTTNSWDDQIRWEVNAFQVSAVPAPAAVWLFASGLISVFGITRKKRFARSN